MYKQKLFVKKKTYEHMIYLVWNYYIFCDVTPCVDITGFSDQIVRVRLDPVLSRFVRERCIGVAWTYLRALSFNFLQVIIIATTIVV